VGKWDREGWSWVCVDELLTTIHTETQSHWRHRETKMCLRVISIKGQESRDAYHHFSSLANSSTLFLREPLRDSFSVMLWPTHA
jgi:hypothetical protein